MLLRIIKRQAADYFAIFVAIIALGVSIYQGKIQHDLTISGWKPVLTIELLLNDAETKKGFLLRNVGLGPSEIYSFQYYINRKDFRKKSYKTWLDENNYFRIPNVGSKNWDTINNLSKGYVISSNPDGNNNELFLIEIDDSIHSTPIRSALEEVIIEIEYKSIADDEIRYLLYSHNFETNNIRDRQEKIIWEND